MNWKDVTKRLPPKGEQVLCLHASGTMTVGAVREWHSDDYHCVYSHAGKVMWRGSVIAWRYLPAYPAWAKFGSRPNQRAKTPLTVGGAPE